MNYRTTGVGTFHERAAAPRGDRWTRLVIVSPLFVTPLFVAVFGDQGGDRRSIVNPPANLCTDQPAERRARLANRQVQADTSPG